MRGCRDETGIKSKCLPFCSARKKEPASHKGKGVFQRFKGVICSPPGACLVCEMKYGCSKLISVGYAWKLDNGKRKVGCSSEQRSTRNFALRLLGQAFLLTGFWTTDWLSGNDTVSRQSYWFLGLAPSQLSLLDRGTEQPKAGQTLQVNACAQLGEPVTGSLKGLEGNDCLACLCPQRGGEGSPWEVLAAVCCW